MSKEKKRVLVGMSGGVDSSVTAALLKKRGYDVVGVTFQMLPKATQENSACCNLNSITDAKRVANFLNIPHYTLNIRDDFEHHVIDNFIHQYEIGQTPNPCVECNRHIKFDLLLKKADELNIEYVATGHYSKITYSHKTGVHRLKKAADKHKDQSYFLYMMPAKTLKRTLFPLGKYPKSEVRKLAEKFKLINAKKADSQEICFVTQKKYKEFLEPKIAESAKTSGLIVDMNGKVLGNHTGLYQYTIGQRKGLGLASHEPYYVQKIDPKTNTLVVGKKGSLFEQEISLHSLTITDPSESLLNTRYDIKFRYQMPPIKGRITEQSDTTATLKLETPMEFIAPGQSCVIYANDRVVGGGVIETAN